jgi:WD40 repeat protein
VAHSERWSDVTLPDGVTWLPSAGVKPENLPLDGVRAIAFSPDDEVVASGSGALLKQWDARTGTPARPDRLVSFDTGFSASHPVLINTIEYEPGASGEIVTGSTVLAVRWDTETDERLATLWHPTGRSDTNIHQTDLALADSGRGVVALSNGQVVAYDAAGLPDDAAAAHIDVGFRFGAIEQAASNLNLVTQVPALGGLDISPAGDRFVVASGAGLVVGALDGSRLLANAIPRGFADKLSIDPSGSFAITATRPEGGDQLWDLSAQPPVIIEFDAMDRGLEAAFDPDPTGATISIYEFDLEGNPRLGYFDGVTLEPLPFTGQPCCGLGLAYSPDGRLLAQGSPQGGAISVLDRFDGSPVATLREGTPVRTLDFSSDGTRLIGSSFDGRAIIWETTNWDQLETSGAIDEVAVAGYSPSGTYLVTGSADGTLTLRDPPTTEPIRELSGAHDVTEVFALGPHFSPDDTLMVSMFDGVPRLWDTSTGTQIGDGFPNDEGVVAAGAEGEALRLVTGVGDHVLVWNLDTDSWLEVACRAAGRNFTRSEWVKFGPTGTEYRATCPQHPIES